MNLLLAAEIRRRWTAGETQKALAAAFGVTAPSIHACVHGRLYPDQPIPAKPRQPRSRGLSATTARVLALFAHRRTGISRPEVVEALGISPSAASTALKGLRDRGLLEMVGRYHTTRYRQIKPAVVLVAPRGDRPRSLGLRNAWLRQHGHQAEMIEEAGP